jgi:hypothetical protein
MGKREIEGRDTRRRKHGLKALLPAKGGFPPDCCRSMDRGERRFPPKAELHQIEFAARKRPLAKTTSAAPLSCYRTDPRTYQVPRPMEPLVERNRRKRMAVAKNSFRYAPSRRERHVLPPDIGPMSSAKGNKTRHR